MYPTISPLIIAKLVEAHVEKNEKKFKAYANMIAEKYMEQEDTRAANLIYSRLDGTYKTKSVIRQQNN